MTSLILFYFFIAVIFVGGAVGPEPSVGPRSQLAMHSVSSAPPLSLSSLSLISIFPLYYSCFIWEFGRGSSLYLKDF